MCSGTWTLVFRFAWKALYPLSHLPSLFFFFLIFRTRDGEGREQTCYRTECWLRLLYTQSGANKSPCLNDGNLNRGGGWERFCLKTGPELRDRLDVKETKGEGVFRVTLRFHPEQQDGWMDGTAIHWDKGRTGACCLYIWIMPDQVTLGFLPKINSIIMPGIVCLSQVLKDWLFGALSCPEHLCFLLISQQHFLGRGAFFRECCDSGKVKNHWLIMFPRRSHSINTCLGPQSRGTTLMDGNFLGLGEESDPLPSALPKAVTHHAKWPPGFLFL